MEELIKRLRALWADIGPVPRAGLLVLTAVAVGFIAWWSLWAGHGEEQVLFADLDPHDAAAIVTELKKDKVPYRLTDDGTRILVDARVVHEVRLGLMSKGVPISGGVGFEIFDNKDVGMTESMQRINYQRALQGELARTIMANDQLRSARVHLVVEEGGLFSRDKAHPKAGVSLVLRPDAHLSNSQILGIQRLVAAAVPGLDAQQVTVTDQRGVALSAEADGEDPGGATGKLRLKKQADDYLTRKVAEVLDRTFGPGRAIVSVDATLNFEEIRRTDQNIVPMKGQGTEIGAVVRRRESQVRPASPQATTTVKAVDTVEDPPAPGSGPLTSTTEVEYEFSKSAEQVLSTPGSIRRVSVGAIVPENMTEDQLARVREVIAMSVGFNAERGDAITVQPLSRIVTQLKETGAEAGAADQTSAVRDIPPGVSASQHRFVGLAWWPQGATAQGLTIAVALMVVVFVVIFLRHRAVPVDHRRLSASERRQLLEEVRSWIAYEKAHPSGVTQK